MSDEDFIVMAESQSPLPEGDDFEEMLEIMIRLAQSDGREFLAYLLSMALMEARNDPAQHTYLSH